MTSFRPRIRLAWALDIGPLTNQAPKEEKLEGRESGILLTIPFIQREGGEREAWSEARGGSTVVTFCGKRGYQ